MNVFDQAIKLTDQLAEQVADLESRCADEFQRPSCSTGQLGDAIRILWPQIVAASQAGAVSPDAQYVAGLYASIVAEMNLPEPDRFVDRTDYPWERFYSVGCGDEATCEDAWVICELYWGRYVQHFPLTLGWLLVNGIRLQHGMPAITPQPEFTEQFVKYLRWAGPGLYDAESLRGLFYQYESSAQARATD